MEDLAAANHAINELKLFVKDEKRLKIRNGKVTAIKELESILTPCSNILGQSKELE